MGAPEVIVPQDIVKPLVGNIVKTLGQHNVWNCDAEWNIWDSDRYLNGSAVDCNSLHSYNGWGTNAIPVGMPASGQCGDVGIKGAAGAWLKESVAQWDATDMACVHKPCLNQANLQMLYCVFNVKYVGVNDSA
ncbi:unnamed protein product [Nippostrongylus brasiliensis]|uniref:SCP domain-containing protein n=1 Tax=Nippostrongylus brasiliensis TaxID=27835 RepID=A0A0N4YKG1_NIPBR|nr:unnamed protein product [Nippostrongylus brasiliensis]